MLSSLVFKIFFFLIAVIFDDFFLYKRYATLESFYRQIRNGD